jgi:hypothetical protein
LLSLFIQIEKTSSQSTNEEQLKAKLMTELKLAGVFDIQSDAKDIEEEDG